jgi:hypothetical protein
MSHHQRDTPDPRVRTLARAMLAFIVLAAIAGFLWTARIPTEATRIAGARSGADTPAGWAVERCRRALADDPAAPPHRSVILFGVMETVRGSLRVEGELPRDQAPAVRFACEVANERLLALTYTPVGTGSPQGPP